MDGGPPRGLTKSQKKNARRAACRRAARAEKAAAAPIDTTEPYPRAGEVAFLMAAQWLDRGGAWAPTLADLMDNLHPDCPIDACPYALQRLTARDVLKLDDSAGGEYTLRLVYPHEHLGRVLMTEGTASAYFTD
jgi:hypothetical protein